MLRMILTPTKAGCRQPKTWWVLLSEFNEWKTVLKGIVPDLHIQANHWPRTDAWDPSGFRDSQKGKSCAPKAKGCGIERPSSCQQFQKPVKLIIPRAPLLYLENLWTNWILYWSIDSSGQILVGRRVRRAEYISSRSTPVQCYYSVSIKGVSNAKYQ